MKMYQSIIFDIQYRYISLIYYQLSTMRLLRKYEEKSHRSIIKVSFLAKKTSFSMQHFALFHVIKIINH